MCVLLNPLLLLACLFTSLSYANLQVTLDVIKDLEIYLNDEVHYAKKLIDHYENRQDKELQHIQKNSDKQAVVDTTGYRRFSEMLKGKKVTEYKYLIDNIKHHNFNLKKLLEVDDSVCKTAYTERLYLATDPNDLSTIHGPKVEELIGKIQFKQLVIKTAKSVPYQTFTIFAMTIPIIPLTSHEACFEIGYLGQVHVLCAKSRHERDMWVNALSQQYFCLLNGIPVPKTPMLKPIPPKPPKPENETKEKKEPEGLNKQVISALKSERDKAKQEDDKKKPKTRKLQLGKYNKFIVKNAKKKLHSSPNLEEAIDTIKLRLDLDAKLAKRKSN